MKQRIIAGAGLAGLIAACHIKDAAILEAGEFNQQHKALLRFRDRSVAELTGISFEEVSVHKEIYSNGKTYHHPTIALANTYARKVSGSIRGRSIWNLDTVKRYVAPEDFYEQLVNLHKHRISWSTPIKGITPVSEGGNIQLISTMPLPLMMDICGLPSVDFDFAKSPIKVSRYKMPKGTKVYQTIYFPDADVRVFRASITGDLLIIESMFNQPEDVFNWSKTSEDELDMVLEVFGCNRYDVDEIDCVDQKYGKIVELPREQREAILYELTREFNVFSIGRFATWRNILLDDVVQDIHKVDKLLKSSSYGQRLITSK